MSEQELWDHFLSVNLSTWNLWLANRTQYLQEPEDYMSKDQLFMFRNIRITDLLNSTFSDVIAKWTYHYESEAVIVLTVDDILSEFKVPRWSYLKHEQTVDRGKNNISVIEAMCEIWPEYNIVRLLYV